MNHRDCKYYLATDVFKGICKRTKEDVMADLEACEEFDRMPRCRHCKNYAVKSEFLGTCMDAVTAYPDMNSGTCKDFGWN